MSRALVVLLLLTAAQARAEAPWVITVGAGPELNRETNIFSANGNDFTLGASARLDAGYHFVIGRTAIASAAIGAHLGIAYEQTRPYPHSLVRSSTLIPLEAGFGAQLVIANRVLIAPWVGVVDLGPYRFNAYGAELGFDILVRGRDRISAVATFTRAPSEDSLSYNSIGAGIAYRSW